MKKVKSNKLNLNKQTVTNLGVVNGGNKNPVSDPNTTSFLPMACLSCGCKTQAITCAVTCAYTCGGNCVSNNSNCYCG